MGDPVGVGSNRWLWRWGVLFWGQSRYGGADDARRSREIRILNTRAGFEALRTLDSVVACRLRRGKISMLLDYHVHTDLCGHAVGEMEEYVQAAAQKGLDELGFNDHAPTFHVQDPELAMAAHQLPRYVEHVRALQRKHTRPRIRLGIEADFVPGYEDDLRDLLDRYDFDYVYGSVHIIGDWRFDDTRLYPHHYRGRNPQEACRDYFDLVQKSAGSGLFDVLGHMDLIKKFNHWPLGELDELTEQTVRTVAETGVCVEVNTSGLRKPCQEAYPSEEILRLCHRHGVPVTLGSDAHHPGEVAMDFDRAIALLKRIGYTQLASFQGRQRKMVDLD
jgi:histidinol-phosphatase (PHP family)